MENHPLLPSLAKRLNQARARRPDATVNGNLRLDAGGLLARYGWRWAGMETPNWLTVGARPAAPAALTHTAALVDAQVRFPDRPVHQTAPELS